MKPRLIAFRPNVGTVPLDPGTSTAPRRSHFAPPGRITLLGLVIALATAVSALASQTVTVDCSGAYTSVPHVAYLRGVARSFDLNNSSSAIVSHVETDVNAGQLNLLNGFLDSLNKSADGQLFTYSAGNLAYSPTGNAPLVTTLNSLKNDTNMTVPKTMLQISGMPYVFNGNADPNYEILCGATGNYYPLPASAAMMQEQVAKENWIGYLNSVYPNAIWIGTQEPSHCIGFSTAYDNGGCSNPPDMGAAIQDNISRFISYWTPIAQFMRANNIQNGGIQLNAGNNPYFVTTAQSIINAQMPLDYFTIQVYTPSAAVFQAAYQAYQTFQQNPNYQNVKVIIDRYGITLNQPDWSSASNIILFLQDEAMLMPYADMMYGYNMEVSALEGSPNYPQTNMPQVLSWLQNAPVPLRPVTSSTTDLQGLALVRTPSPQKAYIAVWNVSPTGTTRSFSINLSAFASSFTTSNLSIQKGTGTSLSTISNSGLTVTNGNTISGLSLNVNEFLLISLQ